MQNNIVAKSRCGLHGTIMCNADILDIDCLSRNLRWLIKAFPEAECYKFLIHIGHCQRWWERILPVAEALLRSVISISRKQEDVTKRLTITIHGKFSGDLPPDGVAETLIRHGISLAYDTDQS